MHRCNGLVAVGLTALLALTGCTSADPQPSSQSPTVSESNSVLPPSSFDGPEMDALYAEAEQVFLRSLELRNQFESLGDYSEFPSELEVVLADPYLSWMHALYEYGKEHGLHSETDARPELVVRPYRGVTREGSEVALQACQDTRQTPAFDSSDELFSEGSLSYLELYFKRIDGQLRLFYGTHSKVEKCPLA